MSKPTFLATTAIDRFWEKDQKMLFLGPWCLLPLKSINTLNLDFAIIDHPWSKRERYREAFILCNHIYENILEVLSKFLNEYHKIDKPISYWRMIIGPWLSNFIQVFYERYACITNAISKYDFNTILLDDSDWYTPITYNETMQLLEMDTYNLQLYSEILIAMHYDFPKSRLPNPLNATQTGRELIRMDNPTEKLKRIILYFYRKFGIIHRSPILATSLGGEMLKLIARMRMKMAYFGMEVPRYIFNLKPDKDSRMLFKIKTQGVVNSTFEKILIEAISINLPVIYLEGYYALKEAIKPGRFKTRVFATATALHSNECFKVLAAELREEGAIVLNFQHGGDYGIALHHGPENFERSVSNHFFSWGWVDINDKNVIPFPSRKLKKASKIGNIQNGRDGFLYLATSSPRYLYRIISHADGPWYLDYLLWQMRFFKSLPSNIRNKCLFRGYMLDYGWNVKEMLREAFNDLRFDDRNISYLKALSLAEIVIADNRKTSYLEALVSGKPVLLFWNTDLWELRPSAQHSFNILFKAGILHDSPEKAARKLISIADDPEKWWNSKSVFSARRKFLDSLLKESRDLDKEWAALLNRHLKNAI